MSSNRPGDTPYEGFVYNYLRQKHVTPRLRPVGFRELYRCVTYTQQRIGDAKLDLEFWERRLAERLDMPMLAIKRLSTVSMQALLDTRLRDARRVAEYRRFIGGNELLLDSVQLARGYRLEALDHVLDGGYVSDAALASARKNGWEPSLRVRDLPPSESHTLGVGIELHDLTVAFRLTVKPEWRDLPKGHRRVFPNPLDPEPPRFFFEA